MNDSLNSLENYSLPRLHCLTRAKWKILNAKPWYTLDFVFKKNKDHQNRKGTVDSFDCKTITNLIEIKDSIFSGLANRNTFYLPIWTILPPQFKSLFDYKLVKANKDLHYAGIVQIRNLVNLFVFFNDEYKNKIAYGDVNSFHLLYTK